MSVAGSYSDRFDPDKKAARDEHNLPFILDFIRTYVRANGYSPTIREIQVGLGFKSTSMVYGLLDKARTDGLVTWIPGSARTLKVVEQ